MTNLPLLSSISESYQRIWSVSDTRTKGWFMVDSAKPVMFAILLYMLSVWLGPKLMKNRKPFKLTLALRFHSFAMALLNLYVCVRVLTASTRLKYSYICEPCRQSFHPDELQIADALWWMYMAKILEFSDTLFFILRKKNKQMSFLHVYHHTTITIFAWVMTKWFPTGAIFQNMITNSAIHVLMYTYYGLATFGPPITKYLWWKKYLTGLQILQFVTISFFAITFLIADCGYPKLLHYILVVYMISFIILFGNFYKKSYSVDMGCGQGNAHLDMNDYHSITSNGKHGTKTD